MGTCPECEGHCTIECEYCGQEMDCPTCEGTGELEEEIDGDA